MKKSIMFFSLVFFSWALSAQHDHSMHTKQDVAQMDTHESMLMFEDAAFTAAYGHYIQLKDALVASDPALSKENATALQKSLQEVANSDQAMTEMKALLANASLSSQRKAFTRLSDEMIALVKANKLTSGVLYLEYCPMANQNTGGYWLANEKEINNPYFGDMMLHCGKVVETIE